MSSSLAGIQPGFQGLADKGAAAASARQGNIQTARGRRSPSNIFNNNILGNTGDTPSLSMSARPRFLGADLSAFLESGPELGPDDYF